MTGLVHDEGPVAPPRANGELVFSEPWESTAFAMAIALEEQGVFTPAQFRVRLIEAIARWEVLPAAGRPECSYYAHWLEALQAVLAERGLVGDRELHERMAALDNHDHPH